MDEEWNIHLKNVLLTPSGVYVLKEIIDRCNIFKSTFNNNTNQMMYNSGKKELGMRLYTEILDTDLNLAIKLLHDK